MSTLDVVLLACLAFACGVVVGLGAVAVTLYLRVEKWTKSIEAGDSPAAPSEGSGE